MRKGRALRCGGCNGNRIARFSNNLLAPALGLSASRRRPSIPGGLVIALLLGLAAPAAAQGIGGCQTYISITQAPASPQHVLTAAVSVDFGNDTIGEGGQPICLFYDEVDPSTFRFYVNGQDRTSYFTVNDDGATASAVPLVDDVTNTLIAQIDGWDYDFDPRVDKDTAYVDVATPGCPTVLQFTETPSNPYYQGTADFTVSYTKNPAPHCASVNLVPDSSTFRFYANSVNQTSHFDAGASVAQGMDVPLIDNQTNTFAAAIQGYDQYGAVRTDSILITRFVDATPGPTVNLTAPAGDNQLLELCERSCFDATATVSTVPYFSLDAPRNVTLVYHGAWARPRPFIHAEVSLPPNSTAPDEYWLQAKVGGAFVTFTNGEQKLHFDGSSQRVRLPAQFDASTLNTGVYTLQVIVTAKYPTTTEERTVDSRLIVVNESASPFGRGWTMAGLQRLFVQSDSAVLIVDGSGSATRFEPSPSQCSGFVCVYESPEADFSRLTRLGVIYTRAYPDSTQVRFSLSGYMSAAIDRFGNATELGYDFYGRLSRIEDPFRTYGGDKSYISIAYDTNGVATIEEPGPDGSQTGGRYSTFSVNTSGDLVSVSQPGLTIGTTFAYDGATHRLSSMSTTGAGTTSFHYNAAWLLDSISLPAVEVDTGGGPLQTISPRMKFVPWQTVGVPTATTSSSPAAPVDPDTVKATVIDPGGHVTTFTVNEWGQPLSITDTLGTTTITRNSIFATSIVAPTGRTDNYTYNGQFLTELHLEGRRPQYFRYGAYAQLDSVWGPGLVPKRFFLGSNGRVDSVRYAGSSVTRYTYDSRGRILTSKDPLNHLTKFHYDASFGNLDSTLAPGNLYTRTKFDGYGRDSASQSTGMPWQRTIYDVLNRPTLAYDGVNTDPVRFGYNYLYLARVQDQKEQVYLFEHNALGWLTREFDPADTLNRFVRYIHNAEGLVTRTVNRRGDTIRVSYDAAHRIRSKYGQNVVVDSFAYAESGLHVTAWNPASHNELYFAKSGWQDSAVTEIAGKRFRIYYKPDTLLRIDSVNIASDAGISFMARGYRWSSLTGMLDRIDLNGESAFLGTNLDLQPSTFTFPSIQMHHLWTANHTLYDQTYTKTDVDTAFRRAYGYDGQGRITEYLHRFQNKWAVRQLEYDSLGRVTSMTDGVFTSCAAADSTSGYDCMSDNAQQQVTYSYDEVGNRTDEYHVLATGNRLLTWGVDDLSFTYDLDGNTLTRTEGSTTRAFDWTADNRLRSVARKADTVQYDYDPFGRLVRKRRRGTTERYFLWDGDQLLAELKDSATARVAEYAYHAGVDRPLAISTGDTAVELIRYFAQDEIGNVIGYFRDSTASPQFLYNIWGGVTASSAKDTNRLYWKGLMWESDTTVSLYYVRNRWYDPLPGRFISEDPIGLAGGLNKYAFGLADPINSRDAFGMAVDTPPVKRVSDSTAHPADEPCYVNYDKKLKETGVDPCIGHEQELIATQIDRTLAPLRAIEKAAVWVLVGKFVGGIVAGAARAGEAIGEARWAATGMVVNPNSRINSLARGIMDGYTGSEYLEFGNLKWYRIGWAIGVAIEIKTGGKD